MAEPAGVKDQDRPVGECSKYEFDFVAADGPFHQGVRFSRNGVKSSRIKSEGRAECFRFSLEKPARGGHRTVAVMGTRSVAVEPCNILVIGGDWLAWAIIR